MVSCFAERWIDAFIKGTPTILAVLISAAVAIYVMRSNNEAQRARDAFKLLGEKLEALTLAVLDWQTVVRGFNPEKHEGIDALYSLDNTKLQQVRMLQRLYFPELREKVDNWLGSQSALLLSIVNAKQRTDSRAHYDWKVVQYQSGEQSTLLMKALEELSRKIFHMEPLPRAESSQ